MPVVQLLRRAGAPTGRAVRVTSLEADGLYAASTLPAAHARDPLTLLALRINGEQLSPDHGYPCRLIAPSRPGAAPDQVGGPAGGVGVRTVRLLLFVVGAAATAYGGWSSSPSSTPPCRG